MIYLDNASTAPISECARKAMEPYLDAEFGNAGTLYPLGMRAKEAIEKARTQVAKFINADASNIIFTSGGTESNNTVFHDAYIRGTRSGRPWHIITSKIEHDSVLKPIGFLENNAGYKTTYLNVDENGIVSADDFENSVTYQTVLASVMYMNNEIGSINPVAQIGEICRVNNLVFHCDCVQAAGSIPIDVEEIGCDYLSLSSHKIHGPKGVGALYVRDKSNLIPLVLGGIKQEFGLRGGTENVAGIVGFGAACEDISQKSYEYLLNLKKKFMEDLVTALKSEGLEHSVVDNARSASTPGKTLSLRVDGVDAEALVLLAGSKGVCISAGSACMSHEQEPSHVLLAIGLNEHQARETVRISFSHYNTESEVSEAAIIIAKCVQTLHGLTE